MPEPVEILIRKGQTADGTVPTPETPVDKTQEQGKLSLQQSAVNSALINAGKQVMITGINQLADFTGDYVLAETVNATLSIGADALMLLKGGPVGAIAVGTKYALSISGSILQKAKADRELEFVKQRAGMISKQGSRYTR